MLISTLRSLKIAPSDNQGTNAKAGNNRPHIPNCHIISLSANEPIFWFSVKRLATFQLHVQVIA